MFDSLISFIKDFIWVFRFGKQVIEYNRCAWFRFGRFKGILQPGFHWAVPFYVDTFEEVTVVLQTARFAMQDLETRDDQKVSIKVAVKYTITDPKKFLVDCADQEDTFEDVVTGWVAEQVELHEWKELRTMDLRKELLAAVRKGTRELGMKILAVNIPSFTRTRGLRLTGIDLGNSE
jgi:regulator of protease activity HflC (stomatin/prohibitin superfamily)